ncbi:MAG: LptF/LptG family permease [Melioribacter sp.]|uniref:LptF/LptG family permease n=1 Tax=Rosettibacter primus TaxID=3111523 RepID=UPI00247CA739|nr:LptF/LptG family permease [Melioribacter sp.]
MILIRYILKNHIAPFFFSVFVLIAIFLLQFLMKFADRLVGKGLSIWIIIKLIIYNLAWMVVLVIPMSVLVAVLMAFGNMSQNNEIAILKATGISLYKMMIPPFIASIILALMLIYFNNHIYPDANHAARLLMEDISRQKPTLSLVPGVFSQDVPNYSILARKVDAHTNELEYLTIYDYSELPKVNIVTASKGKIYLSKNQKKLIMDLTNGEIHETDNTNSIEYRRLRFQRHKIAMPAEQFTFEQSTPGGPRGDRELGAKEMLRIVDSLNVFLTQYENELNKKISDLIKKNELNKNYVEPNFYSKFIFIRAQQRIKADESSILNTLYRIDYYKKEINRYWVEIHKKYSLPFACLIFVLIGAPLGTMTRKGGFGMAAGISLVFFLIYWAFLIGGEKLADRGLLSPFWGMWSANILLGILGIILTIKSAREKVTLDFSFIRKYIPESWLKPEVEYENN